MERNNTKWIRDKRNNCPEYKSYFNSLVTENKKLLKSRNKEFVNSLKTNKPCELCGNKYENPECYDFDHVVPSDKKFSLSKVIRNSSLVRLSDEIKKCRLLCVNCHRVVHPSNADPFVKTNGKHNYRVRRNRIIIYEEKIKKLSLYGLQGCV